MAQSDPRTIGRPPVRLMTAEGHDGGRSMGGGGGRDEALGGGPSQQRVATKELCIRIMGSLRWSRCEESGRSVISCLIIKN